MPELPEGPFNYDAGFSDNNALTLRRARRMLEAIVESMNSRVTVEVVTEVGSFTIKGSLLRARHIGNNEVIADRYAVLTYDVWSGEFDITGVTGVQKDNDGAVTIRITA